MVSKHMFILLSPGMCIGAQLNVLTFQRSCGTWRSIQVRRVISNMNQQGPGRHGFLCPARPFFRKNHWAIWVMRNGTEMLGKSTKRSSIGTLCPKGRCSQGSGLCSPDSGSRPLQQLAGLGAGPEHADAEPTARCSSG